MGVTVDSAFLIDYLRGDKKARAKADELDDRGDSLYLTTPVVYEVVAGLIYGRSRLQASAFRALARAFTILPFDEPAAERAAVIRAELLRAGLTQANTDIFIAAIAALHGHSVVTRDAGFRFIAQVAGLNVEPY
jgi:predicted nucleic acid-binding protein